MEEQRWEGQDRLCLHIQECVLADQEVRAQQAGTGRFSHQAGGEGGEVALKPPQGTDLGETGELLLALRLA